MLEIGHNFSGVLNRCRPGQNFQKSVKISVKICDRIFSVTISKLFCSDYAYIVAYLYFQGEPSGFDEKDSFQEELKAE